MNYDSKSTAAASFITLQNTILWVGGALLAVTGLIGILNFINAILTGIVTRRKEFAMLKSIGMTRKQLKKMLCIEGLYYAGLAGLCSLAVGIFCSLVIVRALCAQMWFLSYHMILWPLLLAVPILFVISIVIVLVLYGINEKESIVERLREIE